MIKKRATTITNYNDKLINFILKSKMENLQKKNTKTKIVFNFKLII